MEKLSLPEFRAQFNPALFHTILFSTANQSWNSVDSTIKTDLRFSTMLITLNPNIIYLKDGRNSLQLNRVKSISIPDERSMLGHTFIVVCGNKNDKLNDAKYTLIARQ